MLSAVALISGLYDVIVGALLLCAAGRFAAAFGVAPATPPIFSDLNGLFLVVIGIGYYFPWRDPDRYRSYMWLMGPALKGAGAAAFLLDYLLRGSPRGFLLFSASDGLLAALTLWALLASSRQPAAGSRQRIPK
ncbi:MAG: hypothetical protein A3H96_17205 [Acidobacteria bacterium RIFCSPLOWO2_02_FULL_67_36]|nr:MAG: hypothetical protein A3H96_17205 [Acidobacteria bacterium RIFCSPLOWO2_02_FULL_67_36]OFW25754.1 MAG: hypothetical protein A3G21_25090 [Acidobacteria bacterium RIFCSPLOWO2_12_FULL_66_21]